MRLINRSLTQVDIGETYVGTMSEIRCTNLAGFKGPAKLAIISRQFVLQHVIVISGTLRQDRACRGLDAYRRRPNPRQAPGEYHLFFSAPDSTVIGAGLP